MTTPEFSEVYTYNFILNSFTMINHDSALEGELQRVKDLWLTCSHVSQASRTETAFGWCSVNMYLLN